MKIYSVTQILDPYNHFDRIPKETLEAAKVRGTVVHQYLNAYALGLFVSRPVEYEGYCISGERWIDAHVQRVILAETHLTDPVLGFFGHPDLVAETDMGIILPDYKTPTTEGRSWPLQLAAYHHLVSNCSKHFKPWHKRGRGKPPTIIPGALMLSPTGGTAKLRRYDANLDYFFGLFLGALNLKRYFNGG